MLLRIAGRCSVAGMTSSEHLRAAVRDIADFPKEGILFKDITPVLANGALFRDCITLLCETAAGQKIDKVVGIDARGFIFAAAVADRLGVGFVPVRKAGKLPWKTRGLAYSLEYGENVIELHEDAVLPGENVLLVDDLLATGGTAAAAAELITSLGANLIGAAFFIELCELHGRAKMPNCPIHSILSYGAE